MPNDNILAPPPLVSENIFAHVLLKFFGYSGVPEKCELRASVNNNFVLLLRAPYGQDETQFSNELEACLTRNFPDINLESISPEEHQGFCVRLEIPHHFKQTYAEGIEEAKKYIV
jgi:hypothetical protein